MSAYVVYCISTSRFRLDTLMTLNFSPCNLVHCCWLMNMSPNLDVSMPSLFRYSGIPETFALMITCIVAKSSCPRVLHVKTVQLFDKVDKDDS